jgi:drug/metabolite transporter (DMT)-like permease
MGSLAGRPWNCDQLIFSPGLFREIQTASLESTAAVIYMGIFPGAIGYVSWALVLSRLPASRAASFLYLIPAVAIVIAWIWLGEIPTLLAAIGGILVLSGVILVNLRGRAVPSENARQGLDQKSNADIKVLPPHVDREGA